MNIFSRIMAREADACVRLGDPSADEAAFYRRLTVMENFTGGRGFRSKPKTPSKNSQGLTRGERKRIARAAANAKVSEHKDPQFMHATARHWHFVRLAA